jgi:Golgi nucleoside diphosphatase
LSNDTQKKIIDLTESIAYLDLKYPGFKNNFEGVVHPEYTVKDGNDWIGKFSKLNDFYRHMEILREAVRFVQNAYDKCLTEAVALQSAIRINAESASAMEIYRFRGQSEGIMKTLAIFNNENTAAHLDVVKEYVHEILCTYAESKKCPFESVNK